MRALLLSAVLTASLASACNYYLRPGDIQPVTARVVGDQRDAVWQRAINVLLDEGYVPDVLNQQAGYISAKQRDDVQLGQLAGTMAIVTVSPDGVLRVEVSGHGEYTSSDGLLHDVQAEQDKLLKEILAASAAPAHGAPPSATPTS
jgi:hypothetical protein